MPNLNNLADDMDNLLVRITGFRARVTRDVALTILNDLVQVTPVDVGTALSNWVLTLDSPFLSGLVLPAFVPSPRGRVIKGKWTHAVPPTITAQANVQPTIDAAEIELAAKQPGQTIFITNNVPYIQQLNDGSSSQAPAGFVDRARILGEQAVQRARI